MTLKSLTLTLWLAWSVIGFAAYAPAFRALPEISRKIEQAEAPVFGVIEAGLTRVLVRVHGIARAANRDAA